MKIWLITDTHFGHEAIKKITNRPDDVDERMLRNLKNKVGRDDVLIHLGDFAWKDQEYWHDIFMEEIPGKKWLIRGNHDTKSVSWYMAQGWDFVAKSITFKMFGHNILISHIPQYWDGWYDVNVHGHFHTSDHRRLEPEMVLRRNGYQKLLAIEDPSINYQPVTLESFIQ